MTNRHLSVIEEYLSNGGNQTDAWRKFYPKCTPRSASRSSSNFFKIPEVMEVIADKQAVMRDKAIITKEEVIQVLVDIMKSTDLEVSKLVVIKAAVEINKMMGYNAVDKKEITHHGEIVWQEEKTYKNKE